MEVASHHRIDGSDPARTAVGAGRSGTRAPSIPVISTVHDTTAPVLDADYWVANVRHPVRLHQAITAAADEHATFIEISPHPLLTHAIDRNPRRDPSPQRRHPGRDTDDTVDLPHQPQHHPHHPPATTPTPTRTAPRAARYPLAPHQPLAHTSAATLS